MHAVTTSAVHVCGQKKEAPRDSCSWQGVATRHADIFRVFLKTCRAAPFAYHLSLHGLGGLGADQLDVVAGAALISLHKTVVAQW